MVDLPKSPKRTGACGLAAALLATLALGVAALDTEAPGPSGPVSYDRDIRPLLSDRCFRCHGPDPGQRTAELRLDLRADAVAPRRGGARAIAPGDVAGSELWRRVTTHDDEERMPPATINKPPLSAAELALVRRWIEEGADYQEHWSFVAPTRPPVPAVGGASWVRDPIDAFVLERLQVQGLAPAAPADRATLLRRVFLDLTGLPPTLEELDEFLADDSEDAYERVVARLLHEEPYVTRHAERMAVPWLDAARYADTSGIHMDAGRQIWPWRDWLLGALRDGMPFDRFLSEQLAGDLLPDATIAQRVASGFNRNHVTTDEGGAIAEEYLVEYAVDRVSTTGQVFLGLTMGCARCHDHKFDPITQEEFYRFFAYFNSIEEPGLYSQQPDPNRAFEPFLVVPAPEQEAEIARLGDELALERARLAAPVPGEDAERVAFFGERLARAGIEWGAVATTAARSAGGATLELRPDGSVLASGDNPDQDTHVLELETSETGLRLLALEALTDPSLPAGGVGRAPNGNAVLESLRAVAVSRLDASRRQLVRFTWAWADVEQPNGDFRVVNALADDDLGWAVDAHNQPGPRAALFLADEPFGFPGGTRLEVRLEYDSRYAQHAFGRVRLSAGHIAEAGLDTLAAAVSGWYATAPFEAADGGAAFDTAFGPEELTQLDLSREFGPGRLRFNFIEQFLDGRLNNELAGGINATYVARRVFVPSEREVEVSLGSDDGFRLFLDGVEVAQNRVDRAVGVDQDRAKLHLPRGEHTVVLKVVNTGGQGGFYWRALRGEAELDGALLAACLPAAARSQEVEARLRDAWRVEFSPRYREQSVQVDALQAQLTDREAALPRTMVMAELSEPRETYVLTRGQYDHPDLERPVTRGVPAAFGALPAGAPADRRGLAAWMTAPENPLVARVAVNRLWELCFGTGLVATSGDFGMQGEWPSHPELLDWLAVEYREGGWDTKALLTRIVTSSTYRQSSRARPELQELDPAGRLLAGYPRRRLAAEQIRDQALYLAGLLVERLGGPSVKPYQPAGIWKEVAMPQSNTREFQRGEGEDLWRRSLYTYWKRASPPPAMLTFDAPTREFCTIRRGETATPLQALVLWNDEQFVEAARVLAERTLAEAEPDDAARLARMFRRCTGSAPDEGQAAALADALEGFRTRYRTAPEDAALLIAVGEAPLQVDDQVVEPAELAAWTMIANTLLSLDTTIFQR